ncbi:hypothetical protein SprV_0602138200 [Sparganum proliferum]
MRTDTPGAVGPPLGSTRWVISTSSNRSSSVPRQLPVPVAAGRCVPIPQSGSDATETGSWRGTDELRFDEVLMTHLVDPSGGPAAPGVSVRMFVVPVAAGGQGYDWLNEGKQARNSAVSLYTPDSVVCPLLS